MHARPHLEWPQFDMGLQLNLQIWIYIVVLEVILLQHRHVDGWVEAPRLDALHLANPGVSSVTKRQYSKIFRACTKREKTFPALARPLGLLV